MLRLKLIIPLLFIITLLAAHADREGTAGTPPSLTLNSVKPSSLCTRGERVVWSCETVRERRLASLCSSKVFDRTQGYVQYRFGRVGQVELEFPRERVNTQSAFKYSRYTRPLVTYLKVEFVNDGFTYTISDDSNSEEKPPRRDAVIAVKPAGDGAKETNLRCRLPVTGSLMRLEDVVQTEDYMQ